MNTVAHILKGETYGEVGNLGVGEIAEVSDRAWTVCGRFIKKYTKVEDLPDGMDLCANCKDPDRANAYKQKALAKKYPIEKGAVAKTQEYIASFFKKEE